MVDSSRQAGANTMFGMPLPGDVTPEHIKKAGWALYCAFAEYGLSVPRSSAEGIAIDIMTAAFGPSLVRSENPVCPKRTGASSA